MPYEARFDRLSGPGDVRDLCEEAELGNTYLWRLLALAGFSPATFSVFFARILRERS